MGQLSSANPVIKNIAAGNAVGEFWRRKQLMSALYFSASTVSFVGKNFDLAASAAKTYLSGIAPTPVL